MLPADGIHAAPDVLIVLLLKCIQFRIIKKLPPQKLLHFAKQLKFLARVKIACQGFFEIFFRNRRIQSKMPKTLRRQSDGFGGFDKFNYFSICRNLADVVNR
jgi:hypothetical protein